MLTCRSFEALYLNFLPKRKLRERSLRKRDKLATSAKRMGIELLAIGAAARSRMAGVTSGFNTGRATHDRSACLG